MQNSTKINRIWLWKENSHSVVARVLFFILWPFGAWLFSLCHCNKKSSFIIFFLFDLLLLWHMSPTGYGNGYHDFLGVMERFQTNTISYNDLLYNIENYFKFSSDAPKEIYEDMLTWIIKTYIADNYHFYFLIAAIPVAYCQLNILYRVVTDNRSKMCFALLSVLILLIIPRDIIATQNPRFTTGFWICAMSSIAYFTDGRKFIYVLLILFSPIFHSAMWPFVVLFIIGILLQKYEHPLELVAYISIPFLFVDYGLFRDINLDFLPPSVNVWANRYMSDEYYGRLVANEGKSGFWWVDFFFKSAQKFVYIYMTLRMIREKQLLKYNNESANFYSFYLLVFAFVNMTQFIPEFGNRYFGFLRVFCVFVWFKAFYPKYNKYLYLLLGVTMWYIINRYGYVLGGALSVNTPIDIFFMPLPFLVGKGIFW